MEYEFMTIDTPLPPSMPLPRAMLRLPISSTAKIMYARMLDDVLANGIEDMNGILFICFPIVELSAALSRSTMTVKRSLTRINRKSFFAFPPSFKSVSYTHLNTITPI